MNDNKDTAKDHKDDHKDTKGPDQLSQDELNRAGGDQYAYLDQTRSPLEGPVGALGDGISSAVLNPSVYPRDAKPDILHTEAEKAGAEFPTGAPPEDIEDRSRTSEEIEKEYLKARPYLREGAGNLPGQIVDTRRNVPAAKAAPTKVV